MIPNLDIFHCVLPVWTHLCLPRQCTLLSFPVLLHISHRTPFLVLGYCIKDLDEHHFKFVLDTYLCILCMRHILLASLLGDDMIKMRLIQIFSCSNLPYHKSNKPLPQHFAIAPDGPWLLQNLVQSIPFIVLSFFEHNMLETKLCKPFADANMSVSTLFKAHNPE